MAEPRQPADAAVVVVAGATGHLGQEVCLALRRHGSRVRALCRSSAAPETLERLRQAGAEIFFCEVAARGDALTDAGAIPAAAAAVISCLGARHPSAGEDKGGAGPFAVDRDAVVALLRAALAAGAHQFVAVGSLEGPATRGTADFIAAKEEAFDEVRRLCAGTQTRWTVVRPGAMTKEFATIVAGKIAKTRAFTLVGDGSALFSPVDSRDLAEWMARDVVVGVAGAGAGAGAVAGGSASESLSRNPFLDADVTVAGPEDLTYREAMLRVADAVGLGRDNVRLRQAPAWVFGVMAGVMTCLGQRAKAGVFRWLAYCTTHSMVGDVRVGTITLERAVREAWEKQQQAGGGGG
jgi:uncharacterized protein YbjT (DUF2867 family)